MALSLMFYSNPSGATIFVDDVIAGKTPATLSGLKSNQIVSVRLELEGYEPLNQVVTTPISGTLHQQYSLKKKSISELQRLKPPLQNLGQKHKTLVF